MALLTETVTIMQTQASALLSAAPIPVYHPQYAVKLYLSMQPAAQPKAAEDFKWN